MLLAQGNALGNYTISKIRPEGAKAFDYWVLYIFSRPFSISAFALSGRMIPHDFTQGAALGYLLLAFQAVFLSIELLFSIHLSLFISNYHFIFFYSTFPFHFIQPFHFLLFVFPFSFSAAVDATSIWPDRIKRLCVTIFLSSVLSLFTHRSGEYNDSAVPLITIPQWTL